MEAPRGGNRGAPACGSRAAGLNDINGQSITRSDPFTRRKYQQCMVIPPPLLAKHQFLLRENPESVRCLAPTAQHTS